MTYTRSKQINISATKIAGFGIGTCFNISLFLRVKVKQSFLCAYFYGKMDMFPPCFVSILLAPALVTVGGRLDVRQSETKKSK